MLANMVIEEEAFIEAGSVVTKDVPSFCVVVGNPAQVIKQLSQTREGECQ